MTLRRRLVIGTTALLAVMSLAIGTVSVVTLRAFLSERLDVQLAAAAERSLGALSGRGPGGPGPDGRPPASGFLALPGQPEGTLGAIISDGRVFNGAVISRTGDLEGLTQEQAQRLAEIAPDGTPRTVELGAALGDYRVIVLSSQRDDRLLVGLPMSGVTGPVTQMLWTVILVAVAGLLIAGIAAALTVRVALKPLERIAATATRVSELPLERGEVALAVRVPEADSDPATEVGQVGSALNKMLGHIAAAFTARQASEQKVRTFVADASHELRTPLASIRGYAELTRRGGHELPPDVTHALGRVESEAIRMSGLVDDLLLLARLDARRDLELHEVDLTPLLADAISDARATGSDHSWLEVMPAEEVVVHGDAARLQQVLGNLLANARMHTPAGTTVRLTLRKDEAGGSAIIEVSDDGPGIDASIAESVFERFVRGDSSRSRSAGSTGLGLAIVRAIVDAHGGTTEVESSPGSTIFRVLLPLA